MVLLYLTIYVVAIIGVSYYFSLRNTAADFTIASRNRPQWQIILSKAAISIGTGFFLIYTAYTYQYGWSSVLLLVFFAVSYLTFAYWAVPQIYRHSREHNFLTMGDFVRHRFDSAFAGTLLDRVSTVVIFIWILSTFIGGAKIVSSYLDITYGAAIVVTLVLVGGYTLLSGYRAVLITDVVQTIVIFGLLAMAVVGLFANTDMSVVAGTLTESFPIAVVIGIAVFGFFSTFSSTDRYQLIYSAKSQRAAVRGTALGVIPFGLAFVPIILIGLFMRSVMPDADPDIVFMQFLQNFTSPLYLELAAVMLVAGLMSSLDSWLYAIATHVRSLRNLSPTGAVLRIRQNILAASLLLAAFAFVFRDLLSIAILGAIVMVTTSVAMLYVFSGGQHAVRFISSMVCGIVAAVGGVAVLGSVPEALLVPIVGGVIGLLIPVKLLRKVPRVAR